MHRSLVDKHYCFRGFCCLYLLPRRWIQEV